MARPIASPTVSAPMMVGIGFSRRKNSVRWRAIPALSRVCCQAPLAAVVALESFCEAADWKRGAPLGEVCSSPGLIEPESGSFFVKSSPVGLIIILDSEFGFALGLSLDRNQQPSRAGEPMILMKSIQAKE